MGFTGREREMRILSGWLDRIRTGRGDSTGRALVIRGRRRIGKTRLVQEFCTASGLPYAFYQATRAEPAPQARSAFLHQVARPDNPAAEHAAAAAITDHTGATSWLHTLTTAAALLPDSPSILVIDEVPYLAEADPHFDAALKTAWDLHLSRKPVLLLLLGSDLAMLDRMTSYDQPFYGRAGEFTVGPLTPADVQDSTGLSAADAIDAYLVTGGFPEIVTDWHPGESVEQHLARQLDDPSSPLLTTGERSLAAEFPPHLQASRVLRAIGTGERTFSGIAVRTGDASGRPLAHGTLSPLLHDLVGAKKIVAADEPLSSQPAPKLKRYRIADTYLRFWLAHLEHAAQLTERGQGPRALAAIQRAWPSWRGRAVEPVIRESLARLLPHDALGDADDIGGWWNRQNNPEVDITATTRSGDVLAVGSIKWREAAPFDTRDLAALADHARHVPGADDPRLIAVARTGHALPADADVTVLGPEELLDAWRKG